METHIEQIRYLTPDLTWSEEGTGMVCHRDGVRVGGFSLRDLQVAVNSGAQAAWSFVLFVTRTVDP